eukprot:1048002-Prorocentrum_minimum.AAC.1
MGYSSPYPSTQPVLGSAPTMQYGSTFPSVLILPVQVAFAPAPAVPTSTAQSWQTSHVSEVACIVWTLTKDSRERLKEAQLLEYDAGAITILKAQYR